MKYRKKPVVIDAVQYTGTDESYAEVCEFCTGILLDPIGNQKFHMDTLEGGHDATPGDFIIKGVKGEFYPCKPDIFEKTYEKVEEECAREKVSRNNSLKSIPEDVRDY